MSNRSNRSSPGAILELWRPPQGAGQSVGCLATTYTFDPGLFDEQCLARFLEIESEPNREDLAFFLEREQRLGETYAGVLVDHTQAGVGHSLRWDVLPVRLPRAKQHAKLSLLAWTNHVRVIVASANLTEAGCRYNREVAMAVDITPQKAATNQVEAAIEFLRCLLAFVPGAQPEMPEVQRALRFLDQVENQVANRPAARTPRAFQQHLVFTLPKRGDNPALDGPGFAARSSLEEAINLCREHGNSPEETWIASPFFDFNSTADAATSSLCKAMARGKTRRLIFCIPALGTPEERPARLAAPASLLTTSRQYVTNVGFERLPQLDDDGNVRPWHAKMLAFRSTAYSALLAGSSNFTQAGLGIGQRHNAEANVLTIAERLPHAREPGNLEAVWPVMDKIDEPDSAEWLGPQLEEEEQAGGALPLPAGFLAATFRAGIQRQIVLRFDVPQLPQTWAVHASGHGAMLLFDATAWAASGHHETVTVDWPPPQPPEKLQVRWPEGDAFWTLNVEDARQLPPPAKLEQMTADEMLLILAASDPGAALRAWAKRQKESDEFEDELDAAMPTDLDPLRRYDLHATFLHRIRSRARILALLRQNLQRPVWSIQALQWRLEGFIGIKPLAERLLTRLTDADGKVDEAVLTLADFLIVLHDVEYEPVDSALGMADFRRIYRPFLRALVGDLDTKVGESKAVIGKEILGFWNRVVEQCRP